MATDFAPVFEKKFHDKVVPGLLMVLDDNANPRVQAHAGNDFICSNFFFLTAVWHGCEMHKVLEQPHKN